MRSKASIGEFDCEEEIKRNHILLTVMFLINKDPKFSLFVRRSRHSTKYVLQKKRIQKTENFWKLILLLCRVAASNYYKKNKALVDSAKK